MKRIIYLIIILILILKKIKLYITIPFEIDNLSLNLNDEEFMRNLFFNELYINISIGSLKQNIPLKIKSTSQLSYIINSNSNHYGIKFYSEKSSSLEIIKKNKINFLNQEILSGLFVNDNFILGNEKINKKLNFILTDELNNETYIKTSGVFGLGNKINIMNPYIDPILNQLKKLNIIQYQSFTFHFTNKNKGNLIIGNYLFELKKPIYKKEAYQEIICNKDVDNYIFAINAKLKFSETQIKSNLLLFATEYGLIIGSNDYYYEIKEKFFDNKISNGICEEKTFEIKGIYPSIYNNKYFYFICKKDVNIKNFPSLKIMNLEIKFNIELTYEDLFINYNNKQYFLVIFADSNDPTHLFQFLIGNLFLKKYDITFDSDRKIIGFYEKNKKYENRTFWFFLLFLILIGLFLYLLFLIKQYKKRFIKKINAHELMDDQNFYPLK